ncbi:MAG: 1-(5-phosphoribosyl)-5-[(5-phosphoribosylamino)methylideneamino] imidazole-4-carboxamide isomerase [Bacteroidales bacterium]|nr:1-(5-phosphoribosyl)-5-[(5-phosphoribosylamino)methylideneamino] imidazole-4-carboxamide isomerase [Candidatus Liminaster caballi]
MIEIVPAIDIIDGKLVRLRKGDYDAKTEYSIDPVEVAKSFEGIGLHRLHVVDLDGAKGGHIVNAKTLERLATSTSLIIDFGGGVKSNDDARIAFDAGAQMITGGSIAVHRPQMFLSWLELYGPDRVILGADIKDGRIATNGWIEESDARWQTFIQSYVARGVRRVISTDISRDGMMTGPATELYKDMMVDFPELHVTASGGVSCINDVLQLNEAGVPSVIIGKAIYEGRITMHEIENLYK